MQLKYCFKLILKSGAFLATLALLYVTLIDLSRWPRGEDAGQDNGNLMKKLLANASAASRGGDNDVGEKLVAPAPVLDNDALEKTPSPSTKILSPEIETTTDEPVVHGTGKEEWSDSYKIAQYTSRYWDLVKWQKSKGGNHTLITSSLVTYKFKTGSILKEGFEGVDDFWSKHKVPKEIGARENARVIPQAVVAMEAAILFEKERVKAKGEQKPWVKSLNKTKKILLWDGFDWWWHPEWGTGGRNQIPLDNITKSTCPDHPFTLDTCILSQDKADLNTADALVLTNDAFHAHDVPVPQDNPDILKFYHMLESPLHSRGSLKRSRDLLTTYWRGSDIVIPYGQWTYYDSNRKLKKSPDRDYSEGKSLPIAAFISNCNGHNNRLDYIAELKNHIVVDVYGNCGDKSCSRQKHGECVQKLKKDYFFYLSFENSNCRDYITEKFWDNGLKNDLVPIVMGAHPDDYKAMAPFKSYIHIEDYSSPAELATFLSSLMNNPEEYNKYFLWKGMGEFTPNCFFCTLCAMVHLADFSPPPKREKNFDWGSWDTKGDQMCTPEGEWYWTRDNNGRPKAQIRSGVK